MQPAFPMLAPQAGSLMAGGDTGDDLPDIRREPPIMIAPDFNTVGDCRGVITLLDFGQFQLASWMIEQMLWNPRVRGVLETRLNGLVGTEIRWEPGKKNDTARRAARDIVEDWPQMVNAATRKALSQWGLLLGLGLGQKNWYLSPLTRRMIPRLQVYHPQWTIWDWTLGAYKVWTLDGWSIVPSPSLLAPGQEWKAPQGGEKQVPDTLRRWVLHEPWGQHSWRNGLVHSLWYAWLGHEWARRDQARASEKQGLGIVKIKYPRTTDKTALNLLISKMRRLGQEGVIPVEQGNADDGTSGYDATPFEWTGTGHDIIQRTKDSIAIDIAVLLLGHNLTSEAKGGSYAAANVGNLIRDDIRADDALNEFSTLYSQLIRDWAEVNYGDADAAPIPIYVTDPPAANQAASMTLWNVTQAVDKLRAAAPGLDFDEIFNRYRIPMQLGGAAVKPPPAPAPAPGGAPQKGPNEEQPTTEIGKQIASADFNELLRIVAEHSPDAAALLEQAGPGASI